jgi:4-hydroxy-tetrahydrodipicolinate reductase
MGNVRVAINGAAGRMGQRLVALALVDPQLTLVAGMEAAGHPRQGEDLGLLAGVGPVGVPLTSGLPVEAEVVVDFSTPQGALAALELCRQRKLPLVLATTGIEAQEQEAIHAVAKQIPLLWSPNTSLAVNLAMKLSEVAASALKNNAAGVDVEIIERHHRFKEDAPSGTALKFGQIIADVMGQTQSAHGRQGRPGQRPAHEIGYHAVRTGDNPGEHTIIFGLLGETVEITVRATSRDCYAQGALAAAKFLVGKSPGLYAMGDVLGL